MCVSKGRSDREPSFRRCGRYRTEFDRSGVSPCPGRPPADKILQKRAIELPAIELLDRRFRIGQRSSSDSEKIDQAGKVEVPRRSCSSTGDSLSHHEIGSIGKRLPGVHRSGPRSVVQFAVDIDVNPLRRTSIDFGDDVMPPSVVHIVAPSRESPSSVLKCSRSISRPKFCHDVDTRCTLTVTRPFVMVAPRRISPFFHARESIRM